MVSLRTGHTSDRAALDAFQMDRLNDLLAAVLSSNPFYGQKLRTVDVTGVSDLADFAARVPFTTKLELVEDQERNPPYGTNLTEPLSRYSRFCQTSGSTAKPMRWLDTAESWSWMLDCWTRIFEAAGVGSSDRVFLPFSFGPFLGFWAAFEAAARMGALTIPGGGMRSPARLQVLLDNEVTALCATPTYAVRLAQTAQEEGIDLSASKVRRIIVAGEPGGSIPATRDLIERLWPGARVVDHHGMTEMGPVSYECPKRRGVLHVMEAGYYPEVLDPETLRPVAPGELGELVLTNLGRAASPLIRYRTRDLVRASAPGECECGSHETALEGGILGRSDDMVVVRGVNLFPSAVEEIVRAEPGIAEYRVEIRTVRGLQEMSLQIEPAPGVQDAAQIAERVAAGIHRSFALRAAVAIAPSGSLPRFEAKAKRWITST